MRDSSLEAHGESFEGQDLTVATEEYKKRAMDLLGVESTVVDASLRAFNVDIGKLIKEKAANDEIDEEQMEQLAFEQLMMNFLSMGLAYRNKNNLVFNGDWFEKAENREWFGKKLKQQNYLDHLMEEAGQTHTELVWNFFLKKCDEVNIRPLDRDNGDFDLTKYYQLGLVAEAKSADEIKEDLKVFLKENKAMRLRLDSNRQKISAQKAEALRDDKNGYLCVFDKKRGKYRKISHDDVEQIFGSDRIVKRHRDELEDSVFDDPDFALRRSDLSNLDYVPKSLKSVRKNTMVTPMMGGVKYHLPVRFQPENEEFVFKPEVELTSDDQAMRLSDEYEVLIYGEGKNVLLINSLSDEEKRKRREGKSYNGIFLKSSESLELMEPWLPEKFLPRLKKENDLQYSQRVAPCRNIQILIDVYRDLVDKANLDLHQFDLKQQLLFATYYYHLGEGEKKKIHRLIRKHGSNFVGAFESCEFDWQMGEVLMNLAEVEGSEEIFGLYVEIIDKANDVGEEVYSLMEKGSVGSPLSLQELKQGLKARAKNLLSAAENALASEMTEARRELVLRRLIDDFREEDGFQSAARGLFTEMTSSLEKKKDVDLLKYRKRQKFILDGLEKRGIRGVLIKSLQAQNATAPIPEIHWRVDRDASEYDRRFGFDVRKFLKDFNPEKDEKVLLEFGPGNGTFRVERGEAVPGYEDFAICNCLYYPLNTLIGNLIDFEKIESRVGPLNNEERDVLADFLYKILVIKPGQAALDRFEYDLAVVNDLASDINTIKTHLLKKAMLLGFTDKVPTTISTRDENGGVIYPYKVHKPESAAFRMACELLSGEMEDFLVDDFQEIDVYDKVPAYAPGTLVSDFKDVKNLRADQVDVSLGVRSTVYLRDDDYIDFLEQMYQKLRFQGVHVDDSVRDNDGWYYRLAELQEVQKRTGASLKVVMGPGFEGEDFNQQGVVPLALVMTRDQSKVDYIAKNLDEGFELYDLDQLIANRAYLKSLDSTGKVFSSLYGKEDLDLQLG